MSNSTRRTSPQAPDPWTNQERAVLNELATPWRIQEYLNGIDYSADHFYRAPRSVLRDRKAHCTDGAFFAAAALRRIGFEPMIAEMTAVRDDDHLIAPFRVDGYWGAIAKSNTTVLRYREPVFKSFRELVMSYFEFYFNTDGEKTLRGYCHPLRLSPHDSLSWMTNDEAIEPIIDRMVASRHLSVLTPAMEAALSPADPRVVEACFMGANRDGLYDPSKGG